VSYGRFLQLNSRQTRLFIELWGRWLVPQPVPGITSSRMGLSMA